MCVLSHTVKALHLFRRSKYCLVVTTILNKQKETKPKTNNNPLAVSALQKSFEPRQSSILRPQYRENMAAAQESVS